MPRSGSREAPAASDRHVTVVKDAAHQALINVRTLHLVEVHLDRVSRHETALGDDAPVGQDQFGGLARITAQRIAATPITSGIATMASDAPALFPMAKHAPGAANRKWTPTG